MNWNPCQRPVEGAAQRVHEDTQRFSSGLNGCFVVVLDAVCTLVVFVPLLIEIGEKVAAPRWASVLGGGWIVFVALTSALLGVAVAAILGRKLIGLEVNNQRVEADVRRELVLLETSPVSVCCSSSEDNAGGDAELGSPASAFVRLWEALASNYHLLFCNFLKLNFWLTTFEQYMVFVPYIVAAPLLFSPEPTNITLGTLVQLSNSFGRVFDALNIVADNWSSVNEFISCVVRLREFERSSMRWLPFSDATKKNGHGFGSGESVLVARGAPRSHDPDAVLPSCAIRELEEGSSSPPPSDDEFDRDNRV